VAVGSGVSLVAILFAYVVLPQLQRWMDREALIELRAEQLARLRGVVDAESRLREALDALRSEQSLGQARLLEGPTVAVAASSLQLLLNGWVTEAGLDLERVDAAGRATDLGVLQRVPARITVRGDVRGIVYLLARLHEGDPFLAVDELRLSTAMPRPGEVAALTALITLHGYAYAAGRGA